MFKYGVFNEPNYYGAGPSGQGMTPSKYNALYRSCYDAIKTANPVAEVYYGEVAADEDAGVPCTWVTQSLSSSNPTPTDGLAIHTYQWTVPPEQAVPGLCRGIGRLDDWNALLNFWWLNGQSLVTPTGGRPPLLVTEHGYCAAHGECPVYAGNSHSLSESARADFAERAYNWAATKGVTVFSYYHLFNQADSGARWDTGIVLPSNGAGWPASPTASVFGLREATGGHDGLRPESDVNGDGLSDLVTLRSDGTIHVYGGRFSATFHSSAQSFAGTMQPAQYSGTGHYVVDVADVTGEGRADLVTLHSGGNAYVYAGQASGSFGAGVASFAGTMQPGLLAPVGHEPIAAADVTGDDRADLITFHQPSGNVYTYPGTWWGGFGNGVASFAGTMDSARFDHEGHYFVDVSDVTGDGHADLVTLRTDGTAYVYKGQGAGTFSGAYAASFSETMDPVFDDGSGHEPVGVADVTGDGRSDLVTVRDGTAWLYPGASSGVFGVPEASFAGTLVSGLFGGGGHEVAGLLDIDGDGRADLVSAYADGNVYVYRGQGEGFGQPGVSFDTTFRSHRFDSTPGHQFAIEKPYWRRKGCSAGSC